MAFAAVRILLSGKPTVEAGVSRRYGFLRVAQGHHFGFGKIRKRLEYIELDSIGLAKQRLCDCDQNRMRRHRYFIEGCKRRQEHRLTCLRDHDIVRTANLRQNSPHRQVGKPSHLLKTRVTALDADFVDLDLLLLENLGLQMPHTTPHDSTMRNKCTRGWSEIFRQAQDTR